LAEQERAYKRVVRVELRLERIEASLSRHAPGATELSAQEKLVHKLRSENRSYKEIADVLGKQFKEIPTLRSVEARAKRKIARAAKDAGK